MNKNIGQPTHEMREIFRLYYRSNMDNLDKAILALKEDGCLQIITIKVIMVELNIGLFEARHLFDKSKI